MRSQVDAIDGRSKRKGIVLILCKWYRLSKTAAFKNKQVKCIIQQENKEHQC